MTDQTPLTVTARQHDVRRDLVFTSLNEVRDAILILGGAAPTETFTQQFSNLSPEAAVLGDLMAMQILGSPSAFAQRVADDCIDVLTNGRSSYGDPDHPRSNVYRGDWDWEGPGVFQKTSLTVTPHINTVGLFPDTNPSTVYEMELWSARIGGQHSVDLAKTIQRDPGFPYATYSLMCPADDTGRARLPFSDVAKILTALEIDPTTGLLKTILDHCLAQVGSKGEVEAPVVLFTEPEFGLRCTIALNRVTLMQPFHANIGARQINPCTMFDNGHLKELWLATTPHYVQKEVQKQVPMTRRVSSHSYTRANPNWNMHRKHPDLDLQFYELKTEMDWVEEGFDNLKLDVTLSAADLNRFRPETQERIRQRMTALKTATGIPLATL